MTDNIMPAHVIVESNITKVKITGDTVQGRVGPAGTPGVGVPPGGTTGQYLIKTDDSSYNTEWSTLDLASYATESYVNTAIGNLVDNAPTALNTLNELAAAINDDSSFAATIVTALGNKQDKVADVSDIEIGYLDGVTSAIQTQLDLKAGLFDLAIHQSDTTNIHGIADTSQLATQTNLSTAINNHNNETTNVHGIADTSLLATTSYVDNAVGNATVDLSTAAGVGIDWNSGTQQFDVDSTVATKFYSDNAVLSHNQSTTNIHGIADTSQLATTSNVSVAVGDHASSTTNVHGIANTSQLATKTYADDAVSNHNISTTDVHGIANTADLATKTYADNSASQAVSVAISDHESDTTNVHGIANTSLLATKSYADSANLSHNSATTDVHGITDTSLLATKAYADNAAASAAAAIVDSAPTTLNTLNELAAALGDDANYATTISTALGLKAPLESPTFTGTVDFTGATVTGMPTVSAATATVMGTVYGITDTVTQNAALGDAALNAVTPSTMESGFSEGWYNTAIGHGAMQYLTTGASNVAIGRVAGDGLSSGNNNIIIGYDAQASGSGVSNEVTLGNESIDRFRIPGLSIDWNISNIPGSEATSTTIGSVYGHVGATMPGNTSIGYNSLSNISTGVGNTALGKAALASETTGNGNVAIGSSAGQLGFGGGENNVAIGYYAAAMPMTAELPASNNIIIGNAAQLSAAGVSNEITLGNSSINRIRIPGLGIDWTTSTVPPSFTVNQTAKVAAYTLALTDNNTLIQVNGTYAITVPLNSSVAFPVGAQIHLAALSTGVSVVFTSGITSYYTPGLKLRAAGSMATLIKLNTDTWILTGDLSA